MRNLATFVMLLGFACGCGGTTTGSAAGDGGQPSEGSSSDNEQPGDASGTIDAWGVPPDGGPWSSVCPEAPPPPSSVAAPGSACANGTSSSIACEYGDAWWDISCNVQVACVNGTWQVSPGVDPCVAQPGPNPAECPTDPTQASPTCPEDGGLQCYYDQGVSCACIPEPNSDGGIYFSCAPAGGCPSTRPRLGASCSTITGVNCNYSQGFTEYCNGQYWEALPL
jgi:hypothetical protein